MRPARTVVTGQNAVIGRNLGEATAVPSTFMAKTTAQPAIVMHPGFMPLLVFDPQSGQGVAMSQSDMSAIAAA
jgi:hypothetical protein